MNIYDLLNAFFFLACGYGISYFIRRRLSNRELQKIFAATAAYQRTLQEIKALADSAEKAQRTNGGTIEVDNSYESNFRLIVLDRFNEPPTKIIDEVVLVRNCQIRLNRDGKEPFKEVVFMLPPDVSKIEGEVGAKEALEKEVERTKTQENEE